MRLIDIPGQVAEGVLSIVGIRVGTEEPHYVATKLTDNVEIRRYGPRIAAETTVDDGEERARNIGFRRLAGYIFGANHLNETIAMTAPVSQSGEQITMTAPVAQSTNGNHSTIRLFMPSRAMRAKGLALIQELLETGGPFPHRLHLVERQATFTGDFCRDLIEWCEQTIADIEEWPDTHDIGLTASGREQWERILAEPDP